MKTFRIVFLILLAFLFFPSPSKAQTATINWNTTFQTIDGFGASTSFESLTSAQATQFFSQSSGLGYSLLREQVPDDGSCTTVNNSCAGDVSTANLAIALGAKLWSTPWSPPASMKSNGDTICNNGSGNGSLNGGSYGAYATYLSNYIKSLANLGIPLYALSVQNEPDFCPTTYDGAVWTNSNFDTFIKTNLGPTLASAGQTSVRIVMPESSGFSGFSGLASTCMTDSSCYNFLGINAWHDYDATANPGPLNSVTNPFASLNKGYWETEVSGLAGESNLSLCGGCWDPSMADGLLWASVIDNRMALASANSWNFWWFINKSTDNEGLINQDGVTTSKRMYVLGQYAKFVRPGWLRIGATHIPVSGVTVSAYKDPSGSNNFAIVVTNQNASNTNVTFNLSGLSTSTVTPWLTSASSSLAVQASVSVSGGTSFTYSIPASSVVTFTGTSGSISTPWSGIIAPSRAIDWRSAGVIGGIPSALWTQCGSTITPYSGSGSTITNAMAACPANTYLLLGSGTFNLNTGINMHANVELRGMGANLTFLVFTGNNPCGGQGASICFIDSVGIFYGSGSIQPGQSNAATWTSGYPQGTTTITLSGIGSSGITVGQYIYLDQANDIPSNCSSLTSGMIISDGTSPTDGCSLEGGSPGRNVGGIDRNLIQIVKVTGISGNQYTITPGLYSLNWRGSQNPGAWWSASNMQNAGIANLSIDNTNAGGESGIYFNNAFNDWVNNVRSIRGDRNHVWLWQSAHNTVQNSYFYATQNATTQSYGVEAFISADNLVVNNIYQQVTAPFIMGPAQGNAYLYNFTINDTFTTPSDWMQQAHAWRHDAGVLYNLSEGNITSGYWEDVFHGTGGANTAFRNYGTGWEVNKTQETTSVQLFAYNRFENFLWNVWGCNNNTSLYPGNCGLPYHRNYQTNSGVGVAQSIYDLNAGNSETSTVVKADPYVTTSLFRYGNYDVVNAATQWNASEVPTGLSDGYANSVPISHTAPASFYFGSKPAFLTSSKPWPLIGPDVTGGNVPGVAGLVTSNAAMDCYLNSMGGPADGSGSVLSFDANTICNYGTGGGGGTPSISFSPTSNNFGSVTVGGVVPSCPTNCVTITLSNPGTATLTWTGMITMGGTDPNPPNSDFTFISNSCPFPGMLSASASCQMVVRFAPTLSGPRSAAITVSGTNISGMTFTVPLNGTGGGGVALPQPGSPVLTGALSVRAY